MAKAVKCDRCGKFYTLDEKKFRVEGNCTKGVFEYIKTYSKTDNLIQLFDLCDDCAEDLWNWLNDSNNYQVIDVGCVKEANEE